MKLVLTFISVILIGKIGFSQEYEQLDQLIENDWFLTKIIVNDEEYQTPENEELAYVFADFIFTDVIDFETFVCDNFLFNSLTPYYLGDPNSQFITWSKGEWQE